MAARRVRNAYITAGPKFGELGHGNGQMEWQSLEAFSFGDNPQMADELLDLVLIGRKRATCWAANQDPIPDQIGTLAVVLNGSGVPKAIIKTIELEKRRFDEVDATFAFDEGEGDRSLEFWCEEHIRFFTKYGCYAPDMLLWCERFELIERL